MKNTTYIKACLYEHVTCFKIYVLYYIDYGLDYIIWILWLQSISQNWRQPCRRIDIYT